tara:strand:- start:2186 stop:2359 length:174 start_codon:yes stop_codon:yes gene_type:complete
MLKVGALVGWKGDTGIVVGDVKSTGAKTVDVWVWWAKDNLKLRWEHGPLLEVINESR